MDALDLDVLEIGPVRRLVAEAMGQVGELEPHAVVGVLLERHAANLFRHRPSSATHFRCEFYHRISVCIQYRIWGTETRRAWTACRKPPWGAGPRATQAGGEGPHGEEDRSGRALLVPRLRGLLENNRRGRRSGHLSAGGRTACGLRQS